MMPLLGYISSYALYTLSFIFLPFLWQEKLRCLSKNWIIFLRKIRLPTERIIRNTHKIPKISPSMYEPLQI